MSRFLLPKSIRAILGAYSASDIAAPQISVLELLVGPPDAFRRDIGSDLLNQMLHSKSKSEGLIVGDERIEDHHPELAQEILGQPGAMQGDMLARIAVAMQHSGIHPHISNHDFEQFHFDAERLFCMAKEIAKQDKGVIASADAALILEFICDPDGDVTRDRNHDGDPAAGGLHPNWEAESFLFWPTAIMKAVLRNDETDYDPDFESITNRMMKKWAPLGTKAGEVVYDMRNLIGDLHPARREQPAAQETSYRNDRIAADQTLQQLLQFAEGEPLIERILSWQYLRKSDQGNEGISRHGVPETTMRKLESEGDPARRAKLITIIMRIAAYAKEYMPPAKPSEQITSEYNIEALWGNGAYRLGKKPAIFAPEDAVFILQQSPFLDTPALYQSLARAINPNTPGVHEVVAAIWDKQGPYIKGDLKARKSMDHLQAAITVLEENAEATNLDQSEAAVEDTIARLLQFVPDENIDIKRWETAAWDILDDTIFTEQQKIANRIVRPNNGVSQDDAIALYMYASAVRMKGDQLLGTTFANVFALAKLGIIVSKADEAIGAYETAIQEYSVACKQAQVTAFYRPPVAELMRPCNQRAGFYLNCLAPVRDVFAKLEAFCSDAPTGAKPSAAWRKKAQGLFNGKELSLLLDHLDAFLATTDPGLPEKVTDYDVAANASLAAIMWMMVDWPMPQAAERLTHYALRCYDYAPGRGLKAEKIGNACLWSLQSLPDEEAVHYLARVAAQMTYPKVKEKTHTAFLAAAAGAGLTKEDIEDLTVADHGFVDGTRRMDTPHGSAILRLTPDGGMTLDWKDQDGQHSKSPTPHMRSMAPKIVKAARTLFRTAQSDLDHQIQRIRDFPRESRMIDADKFLAHYIDGNLIGPACRALIWNVDGTPAIWREGKMEDVSGAHVETVGDVSLLSPNDGVVRSTWATRLREIGLGQPFDQV